MKDSINAHSSGVLFGRALYALLSQCWVTLIFWPAVVMGLTVMSREVFVLLSGKDAGLEGIALSVYLQVLMCTVLVRLIVKIYQNYILDSGVRSGTAYSDVMKSPEKGTQDE